MNMLLTPLLFVIRICVQTVFLALGQIWANKTRSVLTCLGIIFGVGAVIATVGLLGGMKGFVLKEFEAIGARKMWIWGEVPDNKRTVLGYDDVKVTLYEAHLILDRAPSVDKLTPMSGMRMDVSFAGDVKRGVSVRGIWPEWHEIEDRQVIYGRPFSRIDDEENRQVCLVNQATIDEMGLNTDPSGQYILLNGRRFLCIGLVETKELAFADGGQSDQSEVYIPFNTLKMINPYTGTWFIVQIDSPDVSADAQAEVKFILRKHRHLKVDDEDTFGVEVLQDAIKSFNGIARVATLGGGFVAFISLFVGGIGIMNIMLVSVSERTREIGLRKAVGAKPPIVLLQFLVEAITLCVVGGLIGLAIGQGAVLGFKTAVSWMSEASVPPVVIAGAIIVTAMTGIIFGMFPAIKAARLNPIDALRHE